MRNFVEYIGGPKDGDINEWTLHASLPREITIAGRPADYYARIMAGTEININEPLLYIEGTYRFVRLRWNPLEVDFQVGEYEWQGWK